MRDWQNHKRGLISADDQDGNAGPDPGVCLKSDPGSPVVHFTTGPIISARPPSVTFSRRPGSRPSTTCSTQRDAGRQAADRTYRLRSGRALQQFPGQTDQGGAFQKLDLTLLPNLSNLDPVLLKQLDKGGSGPSVRRALSVGHQRHRLQRRQGQGGAGVDKIDSWATIFEPENMKKLSQCGVAFLDSADEMIPAASTTWGSTPQP